MRIEAKGTRYRLHWTVTVDYIEGNIDILFNGEKNEMEEDIIKNGITYAHILYENVPELSDDVLGYYIFLEKCYFDSMPIMKLDGVEQAPSDYSRIYDLLLENEKIADSYDIVDEVKSINVMDESDDRSPILLTITGLKFRYGASVLRIGMKLRLIKDLKNIYDPYAIRVERSSLGCIGYIANNYSTVQNNCMSATEVHAFIRKKAKAKIIAVGDDSAICKICKKSLRKNKVNPHSNI